MTSSGQASPARSASVPPRERAARWTGKAGPGDPATAPTALDDLPAG
ncbi:hypothetical protein [Streptomyces sp. NBC_00046]